MIATVGPEIEPVMIGVRDYPVRRLVLLYTSLYEGNATKIKASLEPLRIDVDLRAIDDADVLMDTMRQVSTLRGEQDVGFQEIIVNVSSGEKMQTCSALSAAFVNGIPAIGIMDDSAFSLPVLKFSYSELISEAKFGVLEALLKAGGEAGSLQELSDKSGVEKSLLSYHLRTTREGKGLEDMGLVTIDRGTFGRLTIRLSEMGRVLLQGRGKNLTTL